MDLEGEDHSFCEPNVPRKPPENGSSSRYGPCRRVSTLAVGGRNLEDCFVRGELDRVWVSNPIVLVFVLVVTCKYRLRLVGRRRSESGVMVDRLADEGQTLVESARLTCVGMVLGGAFETGVGNF
ncbi:hypothetical protein PoB_006253500 [Plakobranchus ocellatus]|uniref:Uncharacterized protein n=1 Tax=Plakobranchus ocellatus TaxID=259542 RepID=A0AAV4CVY7_9GAST|nr:hypothetical protein PoB_006253500 [Plakobranchus ocellatus]